MTYRFDTNNLYKLSETEEGYLRGNAVVTRSGVFEYMNADGSKRKELRHPDDIFIKESLESLKMIPVTLEHPTELVDSNSAADLAVGQTGENVNVDGALISIPFTITSREGIEAVKNGKKQLSLGYQCDLVEEEGRYNNQEYTHRQTNIKYNHLAIVDRARAGAVASINLDGVQIMDNKMEANMAEKQLSSVTINGLRYDAEPEVANAYEEMERKNSENEGLKAEKEELEHQVETLKGQLEALKDELSALKEESSDEKIEEEVKERMDLATQINKIDSSIKFDSYNPRALKLSAIKHFRPTFDADNKSDDYIQAVFDVLTDVESSNTLAKQREATTVKADSSNADAKAKAAKAIYEMYKKGDK